MKYVMPKIYIENLDLKEEQKDLARRIVKNDGSIRATAPKNDPFAKCLWRYVMFYISPNPQHHCMPVTADLGIPRDAVQEYEGRYDFMKVNDYLQKFQKPIENEIINQVPKEQWHGVKRWANALL